ncbi:MAG TPA: hypothetical protein VJ719_04125 [Chthoniobacterales bacterium]|nr:hypothetical protein [Chthoniobacterales bacterium]
MKAYVMWSGGLDSTALIWHYLQRGYRVSAGYVAFRANVGKTAAELRAIHRMLPFLERYRFSFKGVIGWFRWNYGMNDNLHRGPFGLVGITYSAMLNEKFDEMAIGMVRDDNVTDAELKAFHDLHRSLRPFVITKNRFAFPLRKRSKQQLLATLPPELRQHLWTCDSISARQRKPCGKCPRCRRYQELFRALEQNPVQRKYKPGAKGHRSRRS